MRELRGRWLTLAALALLLLRTTNALAAAPTLSTHWRVESKQAKSETTELTLTVAVEPGWHLNANDPDRPYLIPTTLEVNSPTGTTIASIRYPAPVVRSLGFAPGTALRLYEGTFTIGVRVVGTLPSHFDAELAYQACNDETCLPPRTLAVPFEANASGMSK